MMMLFRETDPWAPLWDLRREMEDVFDKFARVSPRGRLGRPRAFPAVNVWEDGDYLYAEAEVPGVTMSGLEIFASGNELTIKGSRKPPESKDHTFHRRERGVGEFTRIITLPVDVNAEKVDATLKDGVLIVTLPKADQARMRKIAVKAS